MVLETLGVVKAASALKSAAVGLANAFPIIVAHSAHATQQMVTVATPVAVQGGTMASNVVTNGAQATQHIVTTLSPVAQQAVAAVPVALATLGAGAAKGIVAIKAGFGHLFYR